MIALHLLGVVTVCLHDHYTSDRHEGISLYVSGVLTACFLLLKTTTTIFQILKGYRFTTTSISWSLVILRYGFCLCSFAFSSLLSLSFQRPAGPLPSLHRQIPSQIDIRWAQGNKLMRNFTPGHMHWYFHWSLMFFAFSRTPEILDSIDSHDGWCYWLLMISWWGLISKDL